MDPASGSTLGGDEVIIRGLGFLHIDRLTFDGVPSPDWAVHGVEEILAITPPGQAGPATVAVDGPGGSSAFAGLFEYVSDVSVDRIEPAQAPTDGGTQFTLLGAGFGRDVTVLIGARTAIDVQVASDGKLSGWFPPNGAAGSLGILRRRVGEGGRPPGCPLPAAAEGAGDPALRRPPARRDPGGRHRSRL